MSRLVLVVDDEGEFLRTFAERSDPLFRDFDLELETCTTARQARSFVKKKGRDLELVIVDLMLPDIGDSMSLLTFAKNEFPGMKRIAITAHAERDDVGMMCVNKGLAHGYIEKKWSWPKQRAEIKRVLERCADPVAHSRIVEAIEEYLERNPAEKKAKIRFLDEDEPLTLAALLDHIKRGTAFGLAQERVLYELAFEMFRMEKDG